MIVHTDAPQTVVLNRSRLWRMHALDVEACFPTAVDGDEAERLKSYVSSQDIRPARLELLSSDMLALAYALVLPLCAATLSNRSAVPLSCSASSAAASSPRVADFTRDTIDEGT